MEIPTGSDWLAMIKILVCFYWLPGLLVSIVVVKVALYFDWISFQPSRWGWFKGLFPHLTCWVTSVMAYYFLNGNLPTGYASITGMIRGLVGAGNVPVNHWSMLWWPMIMAAIVMNLSIFMAYGKSGNWPRSWLRRLAWRIIKATDDPGVPHVIFRHNECGSEAVIPLGRFFPEWPNAAFECLGCSCVTTDVTCRLVDETDSVPDDGSVAAFAIR